MCLKIVRHWAAVNSLGLRAIWQRLQFIAHSSTPERGSALTDVVASVLVLESGVGVCALIEEATVIISAKLIAVLAKS